MEGLDVLTSDEVSVTLHNVFCTLLHSRNFLSHSTHSISISSLLHLEITSPSAASKVTFYLWVGMSIHPLYPSDWRVFICLLLLFFERVFVAEISLIIQLRDMFVLSAPNKSFKFFEFTFSRKLVQVSTSNRQLKDISPDDGDACVWCFTFYWKGYCFVDISELLVQASQQVPLLPFKYSLWYWNSRRWQYSGKLSFHRFWLFFEWTILETSMTLLFLWQSFLRLLWQVWHFV